MISFGGFILISWLDGRVKKWGVKKKKIKCEDGVWFRENTRHFKHVKFEYLEGYLNVYIKERIEFGKVKSQTANQTWRWVDFISYQFCWKVNVVNVVFWFVCFWKSIQCVVVTIGDIFNKSRSLYTD
jgi:hypothetical protein